MFYAPKHLSLDNITSNLQSDCNITRLRNYHQAINDSKEPTATDSQRRLEANNVSGLKMPVC